MSNRTMELQGANDELRRPEARCLSKGEAAGYLGIGVTLLESLGLPVVKFGRRSVYDRVDLDAWLDEYKRRGRARKEKSSWLVKPESTEGRTLGTGGLMLPYQTADAYAKALGLQTGKKQKL